MCGTRVRLAWGVAGLALSLGSVARIAAAQPAAPPAAPVASTTPSATPSVTPSASAGDPPSPRNTPPRVAPSALGAPSRPVTLYRVDGEAHALRPVPNVGTPHPWSPPQGALVVLGWRYTTVPVQGAPGELHGANAWLYPLARARWSPRILRIGAGVELAQRAAPYGRVDGVYSFGLAAGAQYPLPFVTPFLQAVYQLGFASLPRFDRVDFSAVHVAGLELGADVRAIDFFGLQVLLGVGRTSIGDQWSYAAWVRLGVALY